MEGDETRLTFESPLFGEGRGGPRMKRRKWMEMEKDETRFRVSQKGTHDHRWRPGLFQPRFTFKYHGFLNRAIATTVFSFRLHLRAKTSRIDSNIILYPCTLDGIFTILERKERTRRAPEEEEEEAERRTVRSSPSFTARSH